MKHTFSCIICNSKEMDSLSAVVHPFIAERIWKRAPFGIEFDHCKSCGITFFNPRPSDDELNALYTGYRGAKYQQARQKHEKEYTVEFNRMLGDCGWNLHRKAVLSKIIKTNVDSHRIKSVLDYGGDRGQFIPPDFSNAEKYVYEISGLKPIAGVKTIKKLSESTDRKFDFIMCCHLLEHVPYPSEIINNIKLFARKNTVFYFEVPYELPFAMHDAVRTGRPKQVVFSFLRQMPFLYNYVAAMRPSIRVKMNEHINFFSEKSLAMLLTLNGIDVTYIKTNMVSVGRKKSMTISCLGKLRKGESLV